MLCCVVDVAVILVVVLDGMDVGLVLFWNGVGVGFAEIEFVCCGVS